MKLPVFKSWVPSIIWGGLIVYMTSLPGPQVPNIWLFPNADKIAHFLVYLIFGYFIAGTSRFKISPRGFKYFPLIFGISFALLDELHQLLIPMRSCEFLDFLADSCGIILGFLIIRRYSK